MTYIEYLKSKGATDSKATYAAFCADHIDRWVSMTQGQRAQYIGGTFRHRFSEPSKRKSKTNMEAIARYNAKNYVQFSARIRHDVADRIAEYSKRECLSKPDFLRLSIDTLEGGNG